MVLVNCAGHDCLGIRSHRRIFETDRKRPFHYLLDKIAIPGYKMPLRAGLSSRTYTIFVAERSLFPHANHIVANTPSTLFPPFSPFLTSPTLFP